MRCWGVLPTVMARPTGEILRGGNIRGGVGGVSCEAWKQAGWS